MGCSSSSTNDEQTTSVSIRERPVLKESDAWDIAMAWRDQLRGCVRLVLESEHIPSTIIPTFEWVMFVFHETLDHGCREVADRPKTAAYARAATIAWFALSCCDGYSGVENPQFWKRVFYELLYPRDLPSFEERSHKYPYPEQLPITDAVRFFSQPGRPFPRVKLAHASNDEDDATIPSVFLGIVPFEDEERDAKLQHTLAKLEPFMGKSDVTRSVPVEVDLWRNLTAKNAELLREVPRGGEPEPRAIVSVGSMVAFPQLYLRSLKFTDAYMLDIYNLHSLIPPSEIVVRVSGHVSSFVRGHQLWRGLLDHLHDDSSLEGHRRWRVTHVQVMQNADMPYSRFSVMCSALPHLQGVESIKLPAGEYFNATPKFTAPDWAWLGYAIFHPDAASTSGLKSLEVDLHGLTRAHVAVLTRMATGNNLRGGGATGYLEGRVRSGTEVKPRPQNDDKPSLFTFTAESWVGMCTPVVKSVDHQEWTFVAIPGFGSGWIRQETVIETRTRRAGQSCICALRVENYNEEPTAAATKEALLGLLRVLGSSLTSLHFENSNHMPASTVHTVLRLCPSLTSLRIHHDGSFWADETMAMETPRLEELELTVHGRFDRLLSQAERARWTVRSLRAPPAWETEPLRQLQGLQPACLPYLKALHVISARDGAYEHHQPVLVSFLSKQPVLRYLHWSRGRGQGTSTPWADAPVYRENKDTARFLALLPVEHHLSPGPLHLKSRIAFLSVLAAHKSMGVVAQDLVMLIFQYASSVLRREIFINQYVRPSYTI